MNSLTLITYLAPSLPADFFRAVADAIRNYTGVATHLMFETRISGPLEGDAEPFSSGEVDAAFVCSPSYRWLRSKDVVELLPVAVPADPRSNGKPVYFSDVIVPAASSVNSLAELADVEWAANDPRSLSGFFVIGDAFASMPEANPRFHFSGSHLESIEHVVRGTAGAAAIDSNVLRLAMQRDPSLAERIRVVATWGPRMMQPTIVRRSLDPQLKRELAAALLAIDETIVGAWGFRGFAAVNDELY